MKRAVFWLKAQLITALVFGAGLSFLRTLIAIIALD
jgi:hypothetical protein